VESHDFPTLKRVMWCGGVFPIPDLMYWMKRLPHVAFTGLYGRPEVTIASGYHTLRACPADASAEIPIGAGCDGEELLVLDNHLEPVQPGVIGDLYVRGVGLSPGYWRDPVKTAAVFVRAPGSTDPGDRLYKTGDLGKKATDGLVYLHRRAEMDVGSRDYRIELGEIEAALSTIGDLQEAAVLGIPAGGFEGTLIACAYAPLAGRQISPGDVSKALSSLVPSYMLPSRWMTLPTLPKNASGTIDRHALWQQFHRDSEARTT